MSDEKLPVVSVDGFNLPYSTDSEQAVLGSILLNSDMLNDIMSMIPTADYFYLSNHRLIYETMIELFTLGKPVDYITIFERLKGSKNIDAIY